MSNSLSFTSGIKVFPCPNCRETINTSMQQCSFCGTPIDPAAAEESADLTSRISAAVSDASYLRIALGLLGGFLVVAFVPLISGIGYFGYRVLTVGIPIGCIRWWIKYRTIRTADPDFAPAHRRVLVTSIISGINFAVWLVLVTLTIIAVRHGGLPN